jgi:hypothetical protein
MALGATTYKTPNIINLIGSDMTAREGFGVYLYSANRVDIAQVPAAPPYGIIVTGTDSLTPGTYPSAIGDAALELVDQLGCVVQVVASGTADIAAGSFVTIDAADGDGSFVPVQSVPFPLVEGDWYWGYALTDAPANGQFLMRFQPMVVQYVAP